MHDLHKRVLYFQERPEWRLRTSYKHFIFFIISPSQSGVFNFFGIKVMEPPKLHYETRHFPGSLHVFWVFLLFIKKSDLRIYRKKYVEEETHRALPGFPYLTVTRILHGSQAFQAGKYRFLYISQRDY